MVGLCACEVGGGVMPSSRLPAMTKVHVTALIQRHVARTFNLGLLLIIIGVVPLFLSQSSRMQTPYLFTAGVGLVSSGTILFVFSALLMLLVKVTPGAGESPEDPPAFCEQQVWTVPVDSPPSYEEALRMSQSQYVCRDQRLDRTEALGVPEQVNVGTLSLGAVSSGSKVEPQRQHCSDC